VNLSSAQLAFLEANHTAAMITLRADGTPHVARMAVGLVDGRLWSSGVPSRVRTRHLRRDPRCTLFVFDTRYSWLALETTVTILDGPDAAEMNLRLFREMQKSMQRPPGTLFWNGQPLPEEQFLHTMRDEQRLIYQFEDPRRVYGLLT
jgi:PPOX class probable F420-dependent enzyme